MASADLSRRVEKVVGYPLLQSNGIGLARYRFSQKWK